MYYFADILIVLFSIWLLIYGISYARYLWKNTKQGSIASLLLLFTALFMVYFKIIIK